MPTNEAGLSGGKDLGDGGRTTASDTPGGERNAGPTTSGVGQDRGSAGQVSTGGAAAPDTDMTDGGHLGRGGDPVEGTTRDSATGSGPEGGQR